MTAGPPWIRELNCLWTQLGRPPLWVSGQSRRGANGVNVGRHVHSQKPPFCPRYGYPTEFLTASGEDALHERIRHMSRVAPQAPRPGQAANASSQLLLNC